jgi:hypothetical protein
MISPYCNILIEKGLVYKPLYARNLSNHLPMSLVALDKMSANEAIQKSYFDHSIKRLVRRENNELIITQINDALGQAEYFEAYYNYYLGRLEKDSIKNLMSESISILIKGISASAFHAFIRLSYALETCNKKEIAYALAYWSSEYNELATNSKYTENSLPEIINQINPISQNHDFSPGIIIDRMNEINSILKASNIAIQSKDLNLDEIRTLCLDIFSTNNNFTILHCITACHAFRSISEYFSNYPEAISYLWEAIIVAYLSTQLEFKSINIDLKETGKIWSEIIEEATQSKDDHVIKLVYSCWQEDAFYKTGDYKYIAKRALGYYEKD